MVIVLRPDYVAICHLGHLTTSTIEIKLKILRGRMKRIIAGLLFNSHTAPLFRYLGILQLPQIELSQINEFMLITLCPL